MVAGKVSSGKARKGLVGSRSRKSVKICTVVANPVIYDYRVLKVAESLSKRYNVLVLGTGDSGMPVCEKMGDFRIRRTGKPILTRIGSAVRPVAAFLSGFVPKGQNAANQRKEEVSAQKKGLFRRCLSAFLDLPIFCLYLNKGFLLYRTLRHIKADIYIANDLDALLAVFPVAKKYGAKVIYDAHELCAEEGYIRSVAVKRWLYGLEHSRIMSVDKVMTVNRSVAQELKSMHGLKEVPAAVYNYPKGFDASSSVDEKDKGRKGRRDGDVKFVYQGVYSFGRGLEENILAMHRVTGAVLFLRGYGPWEEKLKNLVAKEKLEKKVVFLPPVAPDETVKSLLFADVGIFTPDPDSSRSIYLSSPNKLYQYIMAGLAVITTDLPEYRRVLDESKSGVLVTSLDPARIAESMQMFINDGQRLTECCRNSLRSAHRYSWESQEKRFLDMIARI